MEMKMRFRAVSRIPYQSQTLTSSNFIAHFDPQASGLHMSVERVVAASKVQKHVVTTERFGRHWYGPRGWTGNVLRDAILYFRDHAIGNSQNFISVGLMGLIVFLVSLESSAVGTDLSPIDCKSLGNVESSVQGYQRPPMN